MIRIPRFSSFCLFPAAFIAAGFVCAAAATGGFAITPVRVDLEPGQRGATLTVRSTSAERKTIQAEIFRWRQEKGEDVYEPTRDLLVNPPLFFLPPDASQTVRIGPASGFRPDRTIEHSYRVYFREVPPAAESDVPGLRVALRVGIPVFLTPARRSAPELKWSTSLGADGTVKVSVTNAGSVHDRVRDVRILPADGDTPIAAGAGFRYVLPSATQTWQLRADAPLHPGPARIAATSETGPLEIPVVLEAD